ncbi:DUF3182 family protein [Cupriavidus malaysiensis]|uniref:DUF3182 family protein n=1 Tax=Cupriavidus malaysiensis TaxID=367825 RepID=A0ABM6F3V3_9BURK|nr:DUF3182 family protein [Cupriavidus malaysiensis]AOZ06021.1 hypothetical protein BKK80_09395 [Cupriavidus malaysiensis]
MAKTLLIHSGALGGRGGHREVTLYNLGCLLAEAMGYEFGGVWSEAARGRDVYLLPLQTVVGMESASRLGIRSSADLFGGVVPFPFVATKAITHGLVSADAAAPPGWVPALARRLRNVVLPGYTAFSRRDARIAAGRLLRNGSVRVKEAGSDGGRGQGVVRSLAELEALLDAQEADGSSRLAAEGLVLERNLERVQTFSVGQFSVGEITASYCGVQSWTRDNRGERAYGGSTLTVVRGGFERLLALGARRAPPDVVRAAVAYHSAALDCFPGSWVSRSNYDVALGEAPECGRLLGVLEQSWRAGGASGAEILALDAFRRSPARQVATVATRERYGAVALPAHARLLFEGEDREQGVMAKYAILLADAVDEADGMADDGSA